MKSQSYFAFRICMAGMLSMAGTMYFPALLPSFQSEWNLTNTAAGWINGVFFAGYAAAAPILLALTDRIDVRKIYMPCAFLAGLSMFLFGWLAEGPWSASLFRCLAGVGLAGTYMPGLRALSENLAGPRKSRHITFYTASYGIGTSLSVYLAGILQPCIGWRWGSEILALGPLAALVIFRFVVPPKEPVHAKTKLRFSGNDLKDVLRNRPAVGYILAYGAHNWELFGFRSWIVAFIVFSLSLQQDPSFCFSPQSTSTFILLFGAPASILGNEVAMRWKRDKAIKTFMTISGVLGCLIGFTAGLNIYLVIMLSIIYGIMVLIESGSLTAGLVFESARDNMGLTFALYSLTGFSMAFIAPIAFGAILDIAGGGATGWGFAFAAMGLGCMLGALFIKTFRTG